MIMSRYSFSDFIDQKTDFEIENSTPKLGIKQ